MTPPTSSGFGTTMRTSRKSYSRKTLTHVSPGSMISSSTSDSDNSLHSLYFTSYHGLINYPQKIPALGVGSAKKATGEAPRLRQDRPLYGPPGSQRSPHGRGLPASGQGGRHVPYQQESAAGAVVARASLDGQQTLGPCPLLLCSAALDPDRLASAPRSSPVHRGR